MSLKDILNDIDILRPIEEKTLLFDNKEYLYFVSNYRYEGQPFARYYFCDFTQDGQIFANDASSIDIFCEFERAILEDDFFNCLGDMRFNLYLILVASKQDSVLYNSDIQFDFKYARKLVLTSDELTTFFGSDTFILMREKGNRQQVTRPSEEEILSKLSIMAKRACQDLYRELGNVIYISRTAKKKERKSYINHLQRAYQAYSHIANWQEIKPLAKGKPLQHNFDTNDYYVRSIRQMTVEGYRNFNERHAIPFKKVNLLYGENGAGKTSLLKAIEFAITGITRETEINDSQPKIEVQCLNTKNKEIAFNSATNYSSLLAPWYNVRSNDPKEFNSMFNRYNYFNTDWASIFAISGKLEINILQLQRFFGIREILRREKELRCFYEELIALSSCIYNGKPSYFFGSLFFSPDTLSLKKLSGSTIDRCMRGIEELNSLINDRYFEEMMSFHIAKIEELFKLLISPNEYSQLKITNDEIVAIHSKTGEEIAMNQMSTGQKVCLALSFMFALFLSNGGSPNVIMLDEPVANLDSLHMLNLLDLLRRFALSDTQIFFTTANPNVAKLFRRKFSFLENDFQLLRIVESKTEIKIDAEQYTQEQEEPVTVQSV